MSAAMVSSYVTGTLGALAITASVTTTWLTLRHQRLLALDDRLWSRRAEAYERLIFYQAENPTFAEKLPAEIAAKLIAYGSEEIQRSLADVRAARGDPRRFGEVIDAFAAQIRSELQDKRDVSRLHVTTRYRGG